MGKINGQNFDDFLVACVTIDDTDLNSEYVRVASDMAYWAQRSGDAEYEYMLAKNDIKRIEAAAFENAILSLAEDYDKRVIPKKPTEKMAAFRADLDVTVRDAYHRFADAARNRRIIDGYLDAIKTKRDMLISLGADLRKERETEPYIKDRSYQTGRNER